MEYRKQWVTRSIVTLSESQQKPQRTDRQTDRAPAIDYKKRREKETQYLVVNIELTEISRLSGSSVTVCQRPLQTQSQYRTQSTFSKEKLLIDRL